MDALIGYTGFVGGNILRQRTFDKTYNSKNIGEIDGEKFNLVICAGVQAKKWLANKEPEKDLQGINDLMSHLKTISAKKFILISTVDVYDKIANVTEDHKINKESLHAYGKNRLYLEEFVTKHFPDVLIIRLPALFGEGLKKNFVFDIIHNQLLDYTHPESEFQFYNVSNLWSDIQKVVANKIPLINFVTEPVKAGDVAKQAVDLEIKPGKDAKVILYNIQTKYDSLFQGSHGYLYLQKQMMEQLVAFITSQRKK